MYQYIKNNIFLIIYLESDKMTIFEHKNNEKPPIMIGGLSHQYRGY